MHILFELITFKAKNPFVRIRVRVGIHQNSITFISLEVIPYVRIRFVCGDVKVTSTSIFRSLPIAIHPANRIGNGRHQHMLDDVTEQNIKN